MKGLFYGIFSLFCLISCSDRPEIVQQKILFDFEKKEELDLLHWQCGTFMQVDRDHATSGQHSLRVEMYPGIDDYPGFKSVITDGVSGYKHIVADFYNPQSESLRVSYRIDDRQGSPPYADRVNGAFNLAPGSNRFSLGLDTLKTSGTKRSIDLEQVHNLLFFVNKPSRKIVMYLDTIRLEQ